MSHTGKKIGKFFTATLSLLAVTYSANVVIAADRSDEQLMPILSYREGAYASGSRPLWAGMIDYYNYVNEVEGGINGVKLNIWECETAYAVERGVECYERFKNGIDGSPAAIFSPNSYPLAEALIETTVRDKIPHFNLKYGRDAATNGSVFPYYFPEVNARIVHFQNKSKRHTLVPKDARAPLTPSCGRKRPQ